jgi:hypothetical protein
MTQRTAWTIKHASDNKLGGYRESFEGISKMGEEIVARRVAGCTTALFATRQARPGLPTLPTKRSYAQLFLLFEGNFYVQEIYKPAALTGASHQFTK